MSVCLVHQLFPSGVDPEPALSRFVRTSGLNFPALSSQHVCWRLCCCVEVIGWNGCFIWIQLFSFGFFYLYFIFYSRKTSAFILTKPLFFITSWLKSQNFRCLNFRILSHLRTNLHLDNVRSTFCFETLLKVSFCGTNVCSSAQGFKSSSLISKGDFKHRHWLKFPDSNELLLIFKKQKKVFLFCFFWRTSLLFLLLVLKSRCVLDLRWKINQRQRQVEIFILAAVWNIVVEGNRSENLRLEKQNK